MLKYIFSQFFSLPVLKLFPYDAVRQTYSWRLTVSILYRMYTVEK